MLSMYLLTYIVVFVMCEGGDWATTRRMSCLHKGVWVPGVRYLTSKTLWHRWLGRSHDHTHLFPLGLVGYISLNNKL